MHPVASVALDFAQHDADINALRLLALSQGYATGCSRITDQV